MAKGVDAGEDIKKAAFGALLSLEDNLPKNVKLSIADEDEVVRNALERHGVHLSTHTVDQDHLDAFKLLCWIGCAIIERLEDPSYHQHKTVLDALIQSLEEILVLETKRQVRLSEKDRVLLNRFLLEEIKGNCKHGIGFNGLFVAFHCFRSAYKQLHGAVTASVTRR